MQFTLSGALRAHGRLHRSLRTVLLTFSHRTPRQLWAAVGDDSLRAAWRGALRAASPESRAERG